MSSESRFPLTLLAMALGATTLLTAACRSDEVGADSDSHLTHLVLDTTGAVIAGADSMDSANALTWVAGIAHLDDDRVVILDAGTSEVLIVSPHSNAVAPIRVGRPGNGPGEYRFPENIGVCHGDTIAVFQPGRLTLLSATGQFARSVASPRLPGTPATPIAVDSADCQRSLWLTRRAMPLDSVGWVDQQYELTWMHDGGGVDSLKPLFQYVGASRYRTTVDGRPAMLAIPWSASPSYVVTPSGVRVSSVSGDTVWILNGRDMPVIQHWKLPAVAITVEDQRRYDSTRAAWIKEEPRYAASMVQFSDLPRHPKQQPAVAELLASNSGTIWVRPFPRNTDGLNQLSPSRRASEIWHIIDTTGIIEATVEVPAQFRPKLIRDSVVYGVWTDRGDIQSVRKLSLKHKRE